jgi:hypothetical protein
MNRNDLPQHFRRHALLEELDFGTVYEIGVGVRPFGSEMENSPSFSKLSKISWEMLRYTGTFNSHVKAMACFQLHDCR